MKKMYPLLSVLFLIFWGCLDPLNIFDFNDDETVDVETTVNLWGVDYSITNTTTLDLSNSGLTGSIPPEIANLNKLTRLDLSGNQLSGSLPSEMGDMTNLNYLDLRNNQLSGEIPQSFCGLLPNLRYQYYLFDTIIYEGVHFYSDMNQLCPPYPSCIETYVGEQNLCPCGLEEDNLVNLWDYCYPIESTTAINLSNRGLSGSIPPEIGNLVNLTILDLSENQLTGSIPPEIGNLINLTKLDLGTNQLTGSIPPEIGNLINLKFLYLDDNQLTGSIPPEIGDLTSLLGLRLNHNQFSGLIPASICGLNLTWYTGQINSSSPISRINNNQLCPPYPVCLSGTYNDFWGYTWPKVGEQDISDCN